MLQNFYFLYLQIENATNHSGRRTLASSALNAGIDSSVVAKTTKHRDPKSLLVYYETDARSKLKVL